MLFLSEMVSGCYDSRGGINITRVHCSVIGTLSVMCKMFCECAVEVESMNFLFHQHDSLLVYESV